MSGKNLVVLALVLGLVVAASPASAHGLDLSTARVTLRDGHVEVVADVDIVQLVARVAPEAGDATSLATSSDEALSTFVAETRGAVEGGAHLDVDGSPLTLVLRAFPTPKEVRFLAAQASAAPQGHGPTSTLRFEATRPVVEARDISVTLPRALGPVLYTFVQPSTRLMTPGTPASFAVLGAPRTTPDQVVPTPGTRPWLALAAGAFAVVAVLAQLLPRRKSANAPLPVEPSKGTA